MFKALSKYHLLLLLILIISQGQLSAFSSTNAPLKFAHSQHHLHIEKSGQSIFHTKKITPHQEDRFFEVEEEEEEKSGIVKAKKSVYDLDAYLLYAFLLCLTISLFSFADRLNAFSPTQRYLLLQVFRL